jgi:glycosyltransferase involved in cell wall biosynthesis
MERSLNDRIVAARCAVDLTRALDTDRNDGIARLQMETARAVLAAGGRAFWIDELLLGLYEVDAATFSKLFDRVADETRPLGRGVRMRGLVSKSIAACRRWIRLFRLLRGRPFTSGDGDVLLMFGAYWHRRGLAALAAVAGRKTGSLVTLVHDLLSIRRPDLSWQAPEVSGRFRDYLRTVATVSDRVLANSNFTRSDFLRFCEEEGLPPPATGLVPPASDLDSRVAPRLTQRLGEMKLKKHGFALMVSTIEPRKNHLFAYQLWRRLAERLGERAIPLVFAGQPGWQPTDLFERLIHDQQMWGKYIFFVERPSDQELAWLYSHAAFTLYPSEFEGWGLPITESLSFGTYCLAADNTSLKEASQGLAWHADTLYGRDWFAEIERCILDPAYLEQKRAQIVARYIKRRWSDFAADVLAEIKKIEPRSAPPARRSPGKHE